MCRFKVSMPKHLWKYLDRNTRGTVGSSNAFLNEIVRKYLNQFEGRDYVSRYNMEENLKTCMVVMIEDLRQAIDVLVGDSREARDLFIASGVARYKFAYGG